MAEFYYVKAHVIVDAQERKPIYKVLANSPLEAESKVELTLLIEEKHSGHVLTIRSIECIGKAE